MTLLMPQAVNALFGGHLCPPAARPRRRAQTAAATKTLKTLAK